MTGPSADTHVLPGWAVAVRLATLAALIGLVALVGGCQAGDDTPPAPRAETRAAAPPPAALAPVPADRPRIVAFGDSLTAGLGLDPSEAWPALIQQRLDAEGYRYEVVNAGVSGDTTAGGVRRLDWALEGPVEILVVGLGGNDALRGLPVEQMRSNLEAMIEQATSRDIRVLLCGMQAPPNVGPEYAGQFREVFEHLARTYDVAFLPFLLDGVAGEPAFNQPDGIHPNVEGTRRVADLVWEKLEPLLERDDSTT